MSRRYLLTRAGEALVTLFGVSVVVFLVLRVVPGDEITARLGTDASSLSPTQLASLQAYYGLDKPLVVQLFSWLGNVVTGNLGVSVTSGASVSSLIGDALPVTLELAFLALVIGLTLGISIGVFSARGRDTVRDSAGQAFGLLGLATPNFVLASGIIAVLSTQFGYFPSAGSYVRFFDSPLENLQQEIWPALVLGIALAATIMRTTRSAYLEVAQQDFVRTARGKGLPERRVRWRHILKNALIPIVTITGIQFGYLLGGTVIVEQMFGLPGLGRLVLTAIEQREYAVVQSTVLIIAAAFVLVNMLVDFLYTRIDPRVRFS
ncbi:MAG: transporter permease [Conexibacter sp.]|nr:transporter permease [Conexibacter sp.]